MKGRLLLAAVVLVSSTPASAQDDERIGTRYTKGKRVQKRGTVKSLRGHKVPVAGRAPMTIGQIADGAFKDHHAFTGELRGGRRGLLADPVETDEVVETDDATIITTSTTFTVVDPDEVRARSPRFKAFRDKKTRDGWKLADLGAAGKKEFDAYKAEVLKYPAGHPLRLAAEAGDDALIDAILDGKGDITVTTTVVLPKIEIKRDASGRLMVPKASGDGGFDYGALAAAEGVPGGGAGADAAGVEADKPPHEVSKGKATSRSKFLTGFTKADSYIWEESWKFPSGHLIVRFHAWYEFGLRVPVEIKGTLAPDTLKYRDTADKPQEFEVTLSARTFDAPAAFYSDVGLARDLILDGQEFALGAGFDLTIDVKAGWVVKKKFVIPKNAKFDWGQDFTPPLGNCGKDCAIELWIPASVTRTELSLAGIVTGSARIGFLVAGDGEVSVDFEALFAKDAVNSWLPGAKNKARRSHRLRFDRPNAETTVKSETGEIKGDGVTRKFGYAVSDPRYTWNLDVTPGVRADIHIKAKPFINDKFPIGPIWIWPLTVDLGKLELDRHKGTTKRYELRHGEKVFHERKN